MRRRWSQYKEMGWWCVTVAPALSVVAAVAAVAAVSTRPSVLTQPAALACDMGQGGRASPPRRTNLPLAHDALTIGFGRRATVYKRPRLITAAHFGRQ